MPAHPRTYLKYLRAKDRLYIHTHTHLTACRKTHNNMTVHMFGNVISDKPVTNWSFWSQTLVLLLRISSFGWEYKIYLLFIPCDLWCIYIFTKWESSYSQDVYINDEKWQYLEDKQESDHLQASLDVCDIQCSQHYFLNFAICLFHG